MTPDPVANCEEHSHLRVTFVDSYQSFRPALCPWCEIKRLQAREKLLLERHTGCGCDTDCPVCDELGFT